MTQTERTILHERAEACGFRGVAVSQRIFEGKEGWARLLARAGELMPADLASIDAQLRREEAVEKLRTREPELKSTPETQEALRMIEEQEQRQLQQERDEMAARAAYERSSEGKQDEIIRLLKKQNELLEDAEPVNAFGRRRSH